jgi:dienelactone hydrolase
LERFAKEKGEAAMTNTVDIKIGSATLEGVLAVPDRAKGIVIFAHGSGSSRLSPRNTYVAGVMQQAGLGTLLFDLLTRDEDRFYENRFDIDLLAKRLAGVTRWLVERPEGKGAPLGYFGASTGAAAALQAATEEGISVKAVVSRGGRPDLAMEFLRKVAAPTLFIVGELDREVIHLNRLAMAELAAAKELALVPGATHLFEEPGTLEKAAGLARDWFLRYLA